MSPFTLMMLMAFAVAFTCCLPILFLRRPKKPVEYGCDDGQADVQSERPNITFEKIRSEAPARPFGTRRNPPPPRQKNPTIFLTPRMIEQVNLARRRRGARPFNRRGLQNAVAHPWDRADVRQPQTTHDWLTFLIMYEILFAEHQGSMASGCGGVTIDQNLPYNGQGGEFAGAGASGSWNDPDARCSADAIITSASPIDVSNTSASGAGLLDDSGGPATAPSDFTPSTSGYTSDPTPSYTPDPTPSYSAPDTSSSFSSSDSSSSVSSD